MPFYDIKCKTCGLTNEQLLRMTQEPNPCVECGSTDVIRLLPMSVNIAGTVDQEWKKKQEDDSLNKKAKHARDLKNSGQVPMEETIKVNDPKVSFL